MENVVFLPLMAPPLPKTARMSVSRERKGGVRWGRVERKVRREKVGLMMMMMREEVGFIENTAMRHRWGG